MKPYRPAPLYNLTLSRGSELGSRLVDLHPCDMDGPEAVLNKAFGSQVMARCFSVVRETGLCLAELRLVQTIYFHRFSDQVS